MQNLLQTDQMKCKGHQLPRENLNLAKFLQDDKQLICNLCNHSGPNQIKLVVLEEFLNKFNNQINMFINKFRITNLNLIVARKIAEQIPKIENELKDIERKLKIKQSMNNQIQNYLKNLNYQNLMGLLQYIKNNDIEEQKIKQMKSMLEKEILQEENCNEALNILIKANNEVNTILKQEAFILFNPPSKAIEVYQFDKQVEQDFDETVQVYDIQMNNTGSFLAIGCNKVESDCYAQIWEIDGGILRKSCLLKGHNREVKTLFFNDEDVLFTGSVDSTIKIWVKKKNAKIWDLYQTLEGHSLAVNCIQLCYANQNYFASGSEELIIWKQDIQKDGQWVQDSSFKNNTRIIQALSFCENGNILMVGSDDRLIQIIEYAYNKWSFKHKIVQENKIMQVVQTYKMDFITFQIDGQYTIWSFESINNNLTWKQKKGNLEGQIIKLSFSLAKKLLGVSYQDRKIKLFQIQPDGTLLEKMLDNLEGDLIIMSYLSPPKQEQITGALRVQKQSKFAKIQKNKLQVYYERRGNT
ncbi:unnamed protein product [Paramecium primaurelia]|uniref:WD40-repeat-containing domain n=1 Tax=Paramecium primaurelia TaxID=5886 RepID=A0A8S1LNM6_PARPR|nr:unnamed protein product [Paramecium primaurelia]